MEDRSMKEYIKPILLIDPSEYNTYVVQLLINDMKIITLSN